SYATSNGSAAAPADYAATTGVLTFAPGEASKTISITTVDDSIYKGTRTF
ncbi:Calx-beta domain-containing protein, partial [Vibrio parahaemolyticus]